MNPSSPMSYYQVGAVTVTHDSTTVTGYKTQWVTTLRAGKPRVGSIFTIDQANFYVINEIVDDETLILNKPFIMPNQTNTSYLIINQMSLNITEDDQVTLDELLDSLQTYVDLARDWAIKMDGSVDGVEYSSKYYAYSSKDWAIKMDAPVEGNEYSSKWNAYLSADWAIKMDGLVNEIDYSSKYYANESKRSAEESKAWVVGTNPPPELGSPSDTNNAYYYYSIVKGITDGYVIFQGEFIPTAEQEYPTPPTDASAVWVFETDGYIYTTGILAGETVRRGDWLVYYQWLDRFQIAFVSTEFDLPLASETQAGIVEFATQAEAEAGADNTRALSVLRGMQQLLSRISSATDGTRTDYAASEKAVSDAYNLASSKWTYQTATIDRYGATKLSNSIDSTHVGIAATSFALNEVRLLVEGKYTASDATEAAKGLVEYATNTETVTGTSKSRAVHPAGAVALYTARLSDSLTGTRTDYGFSEYGASLLNTKVENAQSTADLAITNINNIETEVNSKLQWVEVASGTDSFDCKNSTTGTLSGTLDTGYSITSRRHNTGRFRLLISTSGASIESATPNSCWWSFRAEIFERTHWNQGSRVYANIYGLGENITSGASVGWTLYELQDSTMLTNLTQELRDQMQENGLPIDNDPLPIEKINNDTDEDTNNDETS
ncbi:tail fiber protein [Vibrio owensii]|uniref:tail fiber protein n=1 Tax=Vibrio owensii TaxID=696485 RepID=UPI0038CE4711